MICDVVGLEAIALVVRLVGNRCGFEFVKGDRTMNDFEAIALVIRLVGDRCDFGFVKGDRTQFKPSRILRNDLS